MFKHWAQPVTSTPWAIVCVTLHTMYRYTSKLGPQSHHAWEKATVIRGS